MAVYTVYADILWLINFVLDFCLLWAAARFGAYVVHLWRLLSAAAVGAFYGVGLLYPALAPLYIMPIPLLLSLFMLYVGFGRQSVANFVRLVLTFYMLAFIMGGAALAGRFLAVGGMGYGIGAAWLLPAILPAVALALWGVAYVRRTVRQSAYKIQVELRISEKSCKISCFLDSGNSLTEPLTGRPVLAVELAALERLLPVDFYKALDRGLNDQAAGLGWRPYGLIESMQGMCCAWRLKLIPYRSVAGGGMVGLGILPDSAVYVLPDGRRICPGAPPVLLPTVGGFAGLGRVQGLLNPGAVFDGSNEGGLRQKCVGGDFGCGEIERRMGA